MPRVSSKHLREGAVTRVICLVTQFQLLQVQKAEMEHLPLNSRSFSVENQRERRKLLEHNQREHNLEERYQQTGAATGVFSEMHRPSAN